MAGPGVWARERFASERASALSPAAVAAQDGGPCGGTDMFYPAPGTRILALGERRTFHANPHLFFSKIKTKT